jgi:hypothetical protein
MATRASTLTRGQQAFLLTFAASCLMGMGMSAVLIWVYPGPNALGVTAAVANLALYAAMVWFVAREMRRQIAIAPQAHRAADQAWAATQTAHQVPTS